MPIIPHPARLSTAFCLYGERKSPGPSGHPLLRKGARRWIAAVTRTAPRLPSQRADSPCQGEMSRRDRGGRDAVERSETEGFPLIKSRRVLDQRKSPGPSGHPLLRKGVWCVERNWYGRSTKLPSQRADSPCQGEMSRRDRGGRDAVERSETEGFPLIKSRRVLDQRKSPGPSGHPLLRKGVWCVERNWYGRSTKLPSQRELSSEARLRVFSYFLPSPVQPLPRYPSPWEG